MAEFINPFSFRKTPLPAVGSDLVPVTPSDSDDLERAALALYIEGAGAIVVDTNSGNTRTINVTNFQILPVAVTRIRATGTTATGIHAFVRN